MASLISLLDHTTEDVFASSGYSILDITNKEKKINVCFDDLCCPFYISVKLQA